MTGLLVPRKFWGIISETFRVYARNFLRILTIVAIVEVLPFLTLLLAFPFVKQILQPIIEKREVVSLFSFGLIIPIILMAFFIVGTPLMIGALIHAISVQTLQKPIHIGRAYRYAWKRLGAIIGSAALVISMVLSIFLITTIFLFFVPFALRVFEVRWIIMMINVSIMIMGFVATIYFINRWIFIWQAVLLENSGPRSALSRSSALVKGNWWRVFGIVFILSNIAAAISAILSEIPIAGMVIGSTLTIPINVIGITLLYYDLRVKKERYNLDTLAGELQIKTGSSTPDTSQ